jgi:hypothetical protein
MRQVSFMVFAVVLAFGAKDASAQEAKKKVIRLEALKVEGRIQKPQAFYILQRSNLNFQGLELKESFIPKLYRSIEEKPF